MSEFFIDELEIWDFSEKEDKGGLMIKKKVEKRSCSKKRTTSLFRDVLITLNITG
jgi:hypothetical protein